MDAVKIDLSADAWRLYAGPEREVCALALNNAATRAVNTAGVTAGQAWAVFAGAARLWPEYGAGEYPAEDVFGRILRDLGIA
jgi:hypothetical protein